MGSVDGTCRGYSVAESVAVKPVKYPADMLAWRLASNGRAEHLAITTIGAVDCSKAERLELRKENRRGLIARGVRNSVPAGREADQN